MFLNVVLDERRLEFAFEAQRKFDVFRNKMTMVRNYPGTHLPSGQTTQEIKYTDPRVIYYIPLEEFVTNPKLVQKPLIILKALIIQGFFIFTFYFCPLNLNYLSI